MSEALAVADDMLRSFFERWQRLEEAKQEISDDLKELFAEAKGVGFDTKAMRAVFREQVGDKDAKTEFDAICDLYRASLERPSAHPAPAHEKTLKNSRPAHSSRQVAKPEADAFLPVASVTLSPIHAEKQEQAGFPAIINPSATTKGESDAKSADHAEHVCDLTRRRRQEEPHEQDRSEQEQVRSGRNIAVSPAPRNGDDTVPADPDAPTESADAQISATLSPSASPQAVAPEPTPVPTNGSGALIQPDPHLSAGATAAGAYQVLLTAGAKSDGAGNAVVGQVGVTAGSNLRQAGQAVEPFTHPAFLLKDHARQSDVNDRCREPAGCKFSHHPNKVTCASCSSAWAASRRADREREVA